jgi:hypothetical protein
MVNIAKYAQKKAGQQQLMPWPAPDSFGFKVYLPVPPAIVISTGGEISFYVK